MPVPFGAGAGGGVGAGGGGDSGFTPAFDWLAFAGRCAELPPPPEPPPDPEGHAGPVDVLQSMVAIGLAVRRGTRLHEPSEHCVQISTPRALGVHPPVTGGPPGV
jgi:hypothetical protein